MILLKLQLNNIKKLVVESSTLQHRVEQIGLKLKNFFFFYVVCFSSYRKVALDSEEW